MTEMLCEYVSRNPIYEKNDRPKVLARWVNKQSLGQEGFTALHYASFHGNLGTIRYLISKGADPFAKNKHFINMMHVSA
eukprot:CAMPEP_0202957706 /NCGR_PEP_ID=MMETSP1396-20130829/2092_1 /ASSEMBLY_ACC=CAM_ASM_000872 /TAXON_ID= /ORGANISM="Pseudokeronopsis sp., Strain Brazil" /LENGTH=78 /DNA_ID=CAMNT_0049675345 /DNA_START=572 /DNA_END=808 /DNA_ORIENTATION=-